MSDTGSNDSYTTTTSTSWLERIKQAIGGVVAGFVIVGVGCYLLFWNEGRAVQTARSLAEGGAAVVSAEPARVDPANEGKLIHLTGPVKVGSLVADSEFVVSASGIRLVRTVEMYQWEEEKRTETRKTLGGGEETVTTYSYRRVWSARRNDSNRFNQPDGHRNPEMRYQGRDLVSNDATIGAFKLSDGVIRLITARDDVKIDPAIAPQLRAKVSGPVQVSESTIYLGSNPGDARVGDHRITYKVARPEMLSVIGRQAGSTFEPYQTQAGDRLLMATAGSVPAKDMFKAAERENTIITWLLRLFGSLAIFAGFGLILRPLVVVADFVPLIGTILGAGAGLVSLLLTAILAPLIIAIAWFYYRPLVSIAVLVAGAIATVAVKMLASRRAAARAQTAPA